MSEGETSPPDPLSEGRGGVNTESEIIHTSELVLNDLTPPTPSPRGERGGGRSYQVEHSWQNISPDRVELLKGFARSNRREMTDAERWLWEQLRRMPDVRFRRQHPIGDYIVDFVCLRLNLIIEVDGAYHNEPAQQQEDALRSEYLREKGFIILRFTNEEVLYDSGQVLQAIAKQIKQCKILFYETNEDY